MSIKVTSLLGNSQKLDGGAMFGNAPKPLWSQWVNTDEANRIQLNCRCLLIEEDEKKILCETGIGAFLEPKLATRYGVQTPDQHQLLVNLEKRGLTDKDIDYIILSHLHFDHAGGLLSIYEDGKQPYLMFPNAKIIVSKQAWERAKTPHFRDRASFIPGLCDLLEASNRLIVLEDLKSDLPQELQKNISFFLSHGHTPGQLHTIYSGTQDPIVFCGDLIPGQAWVHIPITMGYDRYAEQVIDEKQSFYETAVSNGYFLFYTHDEQFAASQVRRDDSTGKVTPINSLKELRDWT